MHPPTCALRLFWFWVSCGVLASMKKSKRNIKRPVWNRRRLRACRCPSSSPKLFHNRRRQQNAMDRSGYVARRARGMMTCSFVRPFFLFLCNLQSLRVRKCFEKNETETSGPRGNECVDTFPKRLLLRKHFVLPVPASEEADQHLLTFGLLLRAALILGIRGFHMKFWEWDFNLENKKSHAMGGGAVSDSNHNFPVRSLPTESLAWMDSKPKHQQFQVGKGRAGAARGCATMVHSTHQAQIHVHETTGTRARLTITPVAPHHEQQLLEDTEEPPAAHLRQSS